MVPKRWINSAALVWLSFASVASAQEVQTTERAIPGQYIVVLNDDQTPRANVRPVVDGLARLRDRLECAAALLGDLVGDPALRVDDLLGRKDVGSGKRGEVGATRWIGD